MCDKSQAGSNQPTADAWATSRSLTHPLYHLSVARGSDRQHIKTTCNFHFWYIPQHADWPHCPPHDTLKRKPTQLLPQPRCWAIYSFSLVMEFHYRPPSKRKEIQDTTFKSRPITRDVIIKSGLIKMNESILLLLYDSKFKFSLILDNFGSQNDLWRHFLYTLLVRQQTWWKKFKIIVILKLKSIIDSGL